MSKMNDYRVTLRWDLSPEDREKLVEHLRGLKGIDFVQAIEREGEIDLGGRWGEGPGGGVCWSPETATVGMLRKAVADLPADMPVQIFMDLGRGGEDGYVDGFLTGFQLRYLEGDEGKSDEKQAFAIQATEDVGADADRDGNEEQRTLS